MTKPITPRESDPDIIDRACCPRCGADVDPIGRIKNDDREVVGFKVRHADDPYDPGCSMREWPIYDPEQAEGDVNNAPPGTDGRGLSICRTCLSWEQHIEHDGYDEQGRGLCKTVEPRRDEAGQVLCNHCHNRMRRARYRSEESA